MQPSSSISEQSRPPTDPTTRSEAPRLRTVTGNPFPRKCACGCGGSIPRDPQLRYVVDFSGPKPFRTYLREHSPDFGSPYNRGAPRTRPEAAQGQAELPGFRPAIELLVEAEAAGETAPAPERAAGHDEPEPGPSPEAGRPWASGQLVFNAGQFESARSGFADHTRPGETAAQLRARVNRVILEDLEAKVLALRALHEKLRSQLHGEGFGDVVARGRPE